MTDPILANIGPQEVEAASALGTVGPGKAAKQLLQRHAAMHPPELVGLLSGPRLAVQSDTLDIEEVAEVAELPGEVEGASVRGEKGRPKTWVVSIIYRLESGRSARAFVSYDDNLPKSQAAYQRRRNLIATNRVALGEGVDSPGTDAEVETLRQALADAQADLEAARTQTVEGSVVIEPFEGFEDATVPEIEAKIAEVEDPLEREILKRKIREAEEARAEREDDDVRKGVQDATEPIALVPPADDD